MSKEQLEFITAFLFSCLFDRECNTYDYKEISRNGLNDNQYLEVLDEIENISEINKLLNLKFDSGINKISNMIKNNSLEFSKVNHLVEQKGYTKAFVSIAEDYSKNGEVNRFLISKYPNLEASTVAVIKEALLNGIDVNVLDEKKCIIELKKGNKREILVQATRTSKDSSTLQYIVNDKDVAKRIMKQNEIDVPEGETISKDINETKLDETVSKYCNKPIVVKPKSTNFGTGITILKTGANKEKINKQLNLRLNMTVQL